ncbi:MAG: ABC-2 transporter permease [Methanocorpusculum sp.]|nr:ABC-2 transporter permease [Methanocorpusculum sp.]
MDGNIFGLVKKDLIVMKKPLIISATLIFLFLVLYYAVIFQNTFVSHLDIFWIYLPMIFVYMFTPIFVNAVASSFDNKAKWNMVETSSVVRDNLVTARYHLAVLITAVITIAALFILSIIYFIRLSQGMLSPVFMSPEVLLIFMMSACFSIICSSFYLPLMYLFGFKNDFRQVLSLIIGIIATIFIFKWWLTAFLMTAYVSTYLVAVVIVTLVVSVLLIFLSHKLSCFIFRRTDF